MAGDNGGESHGVASGEGVQRIVGITAPVKEDWSNEFDFEVGDENIANRAGTRLSAAANMIGGSRTHSRRLKRNLDLSKFKSGLASVSSVQGVGSYGSEQEQEKSLFGSPSAKSRNDSTFSDTRKSSVGATLSFTPEEVGPSRASVGNIGNLDMNTYPWGNGSNSDRRRRRRELDPQKRLSERSALSLDDKHVFSGSPNDTSLQSFASTENVDSFAHRQHRRQQLAKDQLARLSCSLRSPQDGKSDQSSPKMTDADSSIFSIGEDGNEACCMDSSLASIPLEKEASLKKNASENEKEQQQQQETYSVKEKQDKQEEWGEEEEEDDDDDLSSISDWDAILEEEEGEDEEEEQTIHLSAQLMGGSDDTETNSVLHVKSPSMMRDSSFQQQLQGLRNLVGSKPGDNESSSAKTPSIPKEWRFTTLIKEENAPPTMVRYPKPSALYSLRTSVGKRFMQETELEEWLVDLVEINKKKSERVDEQDHQENGDSAPSNTSRPDMNRKEIRKLLNKAMPGSLEWANCFLSLIWADFKMRNDALCAGNAMRLFRMMGSLAQTDRSRRLEKKWHSSTSSTSTSNENQSGQLAGATKELVQVKRRDALIEELVAHLEGGACGEAGHLESEENCGANSGAKAPRMRQAWKSSNAAKSAGVHLRETAKQQSREHIDMWDLFLAPILQSFQLGVNGIAREANQSDKEGADSMPQYATPAEEVGKVSMVKSIPKSVLSMVCNLSKWISTQVPIHVQPMLQARSMLLEAQAVAHQLATCVDLGAVLSKEAATAESSRPPSVYRDGKGSAEFSIFSMMSRKNSSSNDSAVAFNESESGAPQRRWTFLYQPPESSAASYLSIEAELVEAVLAQFCKIYALADELNAGILDREDFLLEAGACKHAADPLLIKAECLCDIQLVLYGMSPLTTAESNKLQDALDQLLLELEDWMTGDAEVENEVIEIVQRAKTNRLPMAAPFLPRSQPAYERDDTGISMCIGVVHNDVDGMLHCEQLCSIDPEFRINALAELYASIPPETFLKAKAAFVLATHALDEMEDHETAEELLFECLYTLASIQSNRSTSYEMSLLSELATHAMVMYGDVLVANSKYKYAIGAYESAVSSFAAREHVPYYWLIRRLCSISVQHHDWDRALKYHLAILQLTKLNTNLNEFVYVSERVAMMLLNQRADFAQAEHYLKEALSFLAAVRRPQSVSPRISTGTTATPQQQQTPQGPKAAAAAVITSSSDAHHQSLRVRLQQRLARVLIAANRAEDAARLLSDVVTKLPNVLSEGGPSWGSTFSLPAGNVGFGSSGNVYVGGRLDDNTEGAINYSVRWELLLLLGKACLKLRWLADCNCALDQLAHEVTLGRWCDPAYSQAHVHRTRDDAPSSNSSDGAFATPWPRPRPTKSMMADLLVQLRINGGIDACMNFAMLRARCSLYQGLPGEAVAWVDTIIELAGLNPRADAFAMSRSMDDPNAAKAADEEGANRTPQHKKSSSTASTSIFSLTLGQIGRLYYTRGKLLHNQVIAERSNHSKSRGGTDNGSLDICRECGQDLVRQRKTRHASGGGSLGAQGNGSAASGSAGTGHLLGLAMDDKMANEPFCKDYFRGLLEMETPPEDPKPFRACVDAFLCAFEYYHLIDDALWQAKCLSKVAQVELAQFLSRQAEDSSDPSIVHEDRSAVLERIEETASTAIDLCADIGYSPLMIHCLLNLAELYYVKGEHMRMRQYWFETRGLLNTLYLTTALSVTPAPGDLPTAGGAASSFSYATHNLNAQLEMEQALNNFISLSKEKSFSKPDSIPSLRAGSNDLFWFPDTRVPGVHTSAGLTLRLLTHVDRLVRLCLSPPCGGDQNAAGANEGTSLLAQHPDLLATWNWLRDESWKQFSHCTTMLLPPHEASSLYDDYVVSFDRMVPDAPILNSYTQSLDEAQRTVTALMRESVPRPSPRTPVVLGLQTKGVINGSNNSKDPPSSRKGGHRRNRSDNAGADYQSDASGTSSADGYMGLNSKSKERIVQLRRFAFNQQNECSKCRIARHAELLTTGTRTDIALWSCFHRLKLLAYGQIGQTLHMEEVHGQNLQLLRRIHELTRMSRRLAANRAPLTTLENRISEEREKGSFQLFKMPARRSSSFEDADIPSEDLAAKFLKCHYAFLFTSESSVFKILGPGGSTGFGSPERDSSAKRLEVLRSSFIAASPASVKDISMGDFAIQDAQEGKPDLLGLWDCFLSVGEAELPRLVSHLLMEQPIIVAASLCSSRARAIDALLALIRPFVWCGHKAHNIPAGLAHLAGKAAHGSVFIAGMHPCAVADFVKGLEAKNNEEALKGTKYDTRVFVSPAVINLDSKWSEFPSNSSYPLLPFSFQSILAHALSNADDSYPDSFGRELGTISEENSGNIAARRQCQRLYDGMGRALVWLLRFLPYFHKQDAKRFLETGFCNSMWVEDPIGDFCAALVKTSTFKALLAAEESKKSLARMRLDENMAYHLKVKAKLYRSLVGLQRGCWVWMAVFDHTVERNLVSASTSGATAVSKTARQAFSNMAEAPSDSLGVVGAKERRGPPRKLSSLNFLLPKAARPKPCAHDFGVSRTAAQLQEAQLMTLKINLANCTASNVRSGRTESARSESSSSTPRRGSGRPGEQAAGSARGLREVLSQVKVKKKYIKLEEKRVRYHYGKSQKREKGGIPLDIKQTRLVMPAHSYAKPDDAGEYERVQLALDRKSKPEADDLLDDPSQAKQEDTHWVFLVTQLRDSDKARVLMMRFMDKLEEQVWMHSLRVKLMEPDLLLNIVQSAFESI